MEVVQILTSLQGGVLLLAGRRQMVRLLLNRKILGASFGLHFSRLLFLRTAARTMSFFFMNESGEARQN